MWWSLTVKALVGAGIGWFTNWLAIRMLFRPRQPRRVLGLTIQGVIPRRRTELAHKVAQAFERELLSHEDIKAALNSPGYLDALSARIEDHVRDYIAEKVAGAPKLLRLLISDGTVDRLARRIAEDATERLPGLIDGAASDLEARFDIRQVIRAKIDAFDLERLEAIVHELAHRELRVIELLGGVIGLLVGAALALVEHWMRGQ